MTVIPDYLSFDTRIYSLILNLLVTLILKQIDKGDSIRIDTFYF